MYRERRVDFRIREQHASHEGCVFFVARDLVNHPGIIHVGIILFVFFVGVAAAHVLRNGDFYRTRDSRVGNGLRFCEGGVGERITP